MVVRGFIWIAVTLVMANSIGLGHASDVAQKFLAAGLVNVHDIDSSIRVDLVNSDPKKNFFRQDYYGDLQTAYLREPVARKLSKAQQLLQQRKAGHSLLILDAARPRSVSRRMYHRMKGTRFEKFVAHPDKGSMHNYGIAVDITIVDARGRELDMGFTPFRKGKMALSWGYAKHKLRGLTKKQKQNRQLLADVMTAAGFIPLSFEWWHFNGMPKEEARREYEIIE